MSSEHTQPEASYSVVTDGGSVIGDSVCTAGDFVGRDKNIVVSLFSDPQIVLSNLIGVATDYGSEYISIFFLTLRNPTLRFQPIFDSETPHYGTRLNPKLLSFVIISIFLGFALSTLSLDRKLTVSFWAGLILIPIYWIFTSSMTHLLSKMIKGKAGFLDTLSISLQLVSVLYVVSIFATLIISAIFSAFNQKQLLSIDIYLLTHLVLASIYLPLALKNVHQFNLHQTLTISVLSLLINRTPTVLLSKILYIAIQGVPFIGPANIPY